MPWVAGRETGGRNGKDPDRGAREGGAKGRGKGGAWEEIRNEMENKINYKKKNL